MKILFLALFFGTLTFYHKVHALESTGTYCIELCTNICIDRPDVYPCFNDCTLRECSKGNSEKLKVNNSGLILIGLTGLIFGLILKSRWGVSH